jgi:hypothetical protein
MIATGHLPISQETSLIPGKKYYGKRALKCHKP